MTARNVNLFQICIGTKELSSEVYRRILAKRNKKTIKILYVSSKEEKKLLELDKYKLHLSDFKASINDIEVSL